MYSSNLNDRNRRCEKRRDAAAIQSRFCECGLSECNIPNPTQAEVAYFSRLKSAPSIQRYPPPIKICVSYPATGTVIIISKQKSQHFVGLQWFGRTPGYPECMPPNPSLPQFVLLCGCRKTGDWNKKGSPGTSSACGGIRPRWPDLNGD